MLPKTYSTVSGIIFLLVAVAHLARVALHWEFRVGPWDTPPWVSVFAFLVAAFMAYSGLRNASRSA